jgi:hypothetical protein
LLILRFRNLSTRSWITTPHRILRQIRSGIEFLRPGEPGILHQGDEPGKVMRIWKHYASLEQDGLYAFFDGLLRTMKGSVVLASGVERNPPSFPQPAVPRPSHRETPASSASRILRRLFRPRLAALRLAARRGAWGQRRDENAF